MPYHVCLSLLGSVRASVSSASYGEADIFIGFGANAVRTAVCFSSNVLSAAAPPVAV